MLLNLAVVPLREPEKVDVKVRFPRHASPREVETPAAAHDHRADPLPAERDPQEVDADSVVFADQSDAAAGEDGPQLADEVLEALRRHDTAEQETATRLDALGRTS